VAPVLEINHLIVQYGAAYALKDVSLSVQNGEFVSIIGPNGAGKTTLLRSISRLVPIASGTISFEGERIDLMEAGKVVSRGIIQVPEGRKLVGTASVLDNLRLGAYLGWDQVKKRLSSVYEMFPILEERKNQQARTLSGGQQQMLAIGRALMGNPKLLLLDEVTFGLAPILVNQMRVKLQELRQLQISILLAEQNAELALTLSDRCYVMEQGSIRREGPAAELRDDPQVRAAYLGL
jgi:branched-chain amino acid transport system ATP-binding protein